MKTLFPMLLVALLPVLSQDLRAQVIAGPITNAANGHWYYLLGPTNWTDAEALARGLGGHLVAINDATENAWVLDTFGNYGGQSRTLFIGFSDDGHEGQWLWTSGDPVTYVNWAPGEPNNGGGYFPYENFGIMFGAGDTRAGLWNDIMGTLPEQQYWGVVEVAPTALTALRVSEVELSWFGFAGTTYQTQYRSSLTTNTWVNVGTPIPGSNRPSYLRDQAPMDEPQRFYRVVIVP